MLKEGLTKIHCNISEPGSKCGQKGLRQFARCVEFALYVLPACGGLTPRLTGAGSRRLEGTDIGHQNREAMAYVGVRVEPTVRLGREVEGGSRAKT